LRHIQLESYTLEHTKLVAPDIRHAKTVDLPDSEYKINVYDLRLITPNI
jgi:S-ribosylhomocysteine lyase LuxS involved in autoinducer biosynthesis